MLTHELKDYVVYRDNKDGRVYQCHKLTWAEWREYKYKHQNHLTMLVNNVTQNEARRFCQLARDEET